MLDKSIALRVRTRLYLTQAVVPHRAKSARKYQVRGASLDVSIAVTQPSTGRPSKCVQASTRV